MGYRSPTGVLKSPESPTWPVGDRSENEFVPFSIALGIGDRREHSQSFVQYKRVGISMLGGSRQTEALSVVWMVGNWVKPRRCF